jgi:Tfp pilus assembly PilM family ATPase
MNTLTDLVKRFQRGRTDVVGVDVGATAIKVVRLKALNRLATVVAVDILPAVSLPPGAGVPPPVTLPRAVHGRHVALAYSGPGALVKLLTFPTHSEKSAETQVNELMGLADTSDYRVAYEPISESRTEMRALAVALPDLAAVQLCALFPTGTPAPCSIEVAGLASMTAFERGPGRRHVEEAVAAVDVGAMVTTVAFYNKGALSLIRKFDFGSAVILKTVQETLGVDAEVAQGILADGSFDISQAIRKAMESFVQQFVISRDFVERRENCHILRLYACGGTAGTQGWASELESSSGLAPEFWNPFGELAVLPGAIPDALKGQEARFTAALGAAWAVLQTG